MMAMAFSGSKRNEYIAAFATLRLANGTWPDPPQTLQAGRRQSSGTDLGDYSYTTLDPDADLSFGQFKNTPPT
jgi:hypothetical protein